MYFWIYNLHLKKCLGSDFSNAISFMRDFTVFYRAYCNLRKMHKMRNFRIGLSMRNICARFAQDSFPMRNICARFAQDCTSFSNAQYMRKICARLYFFRQCAIMRKICSRLYSFPNAQYMRKIYFCNAQYMRKIVVISSMRNTCARFSILRIGERSTILRKSCAYIAHWRKKYNLAHILRIGRESCAYIAHILRIDTSNAQVAHLAQNTISLL